MQKWSENYKTSHHIIVWIHKNPKKVSNDFEQLIVHISHLGPSISISRFIRSDGCWLFETLVASPPHLIPIPPASRDGSFARGHGYPRIPDKHGYGYQNSPTGADTGIKIHPRAANELQPLPAGIPATRQNKKRPICISPTH
jgi:hypothetical protein